MRANWIQASSACVLQLILHFLGGQCCILGQIYGNVTRQSSGNCRLDFQTQYRTGGQRTSFYFSFAVRKEITFQFLKTLLIGCLYVKHSHKGTINVC